MSDNAIIKRVKNDILNKNAMITGLKEQLARSTSSADAYSIREEIRRQESEVASLEAQLR